MSDAAEQGVFAEDTRMLSRCRLLLDGSRPLLLTSRAVDYFSATHYLRNAPTARLASNAVSVSRERFVDEAVTETSIVNEGMTALEFGLELELAADFADIISVKAYDFAFGDPLQRRRFLLARSCAAVEFALRIEDGAGYSTIVDSRVRRKSPRGARFCFRLPRTRSGS